MSSSGIVKNSFTCILLELQLLYQAHHQYHLHKCHPEEKYWEEFHTDEIKKTCPGDNTSDSVVDEPAKSAVVKSETKAEVEPP
ncbi:21588_t:CDS:2 [Rhizophagus irregularis]|nr:21588_t:CDS:2 [Rhizophagus irregularis]